MSKRHELTDKEWERLKPLLPPQKAATGRTANEQRRSAFDRVLYRQRNRVECLINRLKQFRRITTRNEKRAENYLAMLTIAAILLWL